VAKKQVIVDDLVIPKYRKLLYDRSTRHIILTSGRAGTKSSFAGVRANSQTVTDPDGSIVVLRKHHNKLRKTVYKEMLRGINRLQIPKSKFYITKSPMEITYKKYGTTIYFSGSDGIDDTKGIIDEDKPIKLVILDELTEFFEDGEGEDELANIEATFIRGNLGSFQMLYLYNPPKNPNAAINVWCRKMEQRPDCLHIHVTYKDVPEEWLGPDLIASAETMKAVDPKMYRWVWGGESVGVDELIYYMFGNSNIEKAPDDRIYQVCYVGADYGQQNATTYQILGLDEYNRRLQGLAEFYHSGRDSGKQRSPSQYAQDAIDLMDQVHEQYGTQVFYFYLDPSAQGLQEEIKRAASYIEDYSVMIRNAENDVATGISRVQKALVFNVLKISPVQKNLVREFGTYEYDRKSIEKGKEVPIKVDDHCVDALRYAVMGAWRKIRRWLPDDGVEDKYPLPHISKMEMDTDEYI
jgi:PBSX family phage terminase large subunit